MQLKNIWLIRNNFIHFFTIYLRHAKKDRHAHIFFPLIYPQPIITYI